jgi:hypothetical protein
VKPAISPAVVWRLERKHYEEAWEAARNDEEDFDDRGVLTLMVKGGIHQLNLVGAEIWTRIDGTRDDAAIAAELAELFGWEGEETAEAVRTFLEGVAAQGWVKLS